MTSPRPAPLASADPGDRLDDARLRLSNLLANDADPAAVSEARSAVAKATRAVYDSRRQWREDSARLDAEADETIGFNVTLPGWAAR